MHGPGRSFLREEAAVGDGAHHVMGESMRGGTGLGRKKLTRQN